MSRRVRYQTGERHDMTGRDMTRQDIGTTAWHKTTKLDETKRNETSSVSRSVVPLPLSPWTLVSLPLRPLGRAAPSPLRKE